MVRFRNSIEAGVIKDLSYQPVKLSDEAVIKSPVTVSDVTRRESPGFPMRRVFGRSNLCQKLIYQSISLRQCRELDLDDIISYQGPMSGDETRAGEVVFQILDRRMVLAARFSPSANSILRGELPSRRNQNNTFSAPIPSHSVQILQIAHFFRPISLYLRPIIPSWYTAPAPIP